MTDILAELENLRTQPRASLSIRADLHCRVSDLADDFGATKGEIADKLLQYALFHLDQKLGRKS